MEEIDQDFLKVLREHGYEYLSLVGSGGFGKVYLVQSEKYNQPFACKVGKNFRGLGEEIKLLSNILNQFIIQIYDWFKFGDNIGAILDYCPNGTIRDYIFKHGPLNCDQMQQVIHSLFTAIQVCHSRNIVHRDIKPSNILIDTHGYLKLSDFGLSMVVERGTLITTTSGSTPFMAPEMFSQKEFDPFAADIWAIGVTLFVMLTGVLPWIAKDKVTLIEEIKKGFNHPLKFREDEVSKIITKCLIVDPTKRPTIDQLVERMNFCKEKIALSTFVRTPRRTKTFFQNCATRLVRRNSPVVFPY